METMTQRQAEDLAIEIFGSYPKTDAAVPEVYLRRLTNELMQHSHEVGTKVANEITGEYHTLPPIAAVIKALWTQTNLRRGDSRLVDLGLVRNERKISDGRD